MATKKFTKKLPLRRKKKGGMNSMRTNTRGPNHSQVQQVSPTVQLPTPVQPTQQPVQLPEPEQPQEQPTVELPKPKHSQENTSMFSKVNNIFNSQKEETIPPVVDEQNNNSINISNNNVVETEQVPDSEIELNNTEQKYNLQKLNKTKLKLSNLLQDVDKNNFDKDNSIDKKKMKQWVQLLLKITDFQIANNSLDWWEVVKNKM